MRLADTPRYSAAWLELRERADAEARAPQLLDALRRHLPAPSDTRPLVVHDLGCGTGSMQRWLAPRLPGRQHWVLHDRDADLLGHAAAAAAGSAADGAPVTVETRCDDVTTLTAGDLAGAALVTASALLDLLTADEVDRLAAACAGAGCPALLTGSVIGQAELDPADPLDADLNAAFNDHLRRSGADRRPLGAEAAGATADAFARHGATVLTRPGPWRLGPDHRDLLGEWCTGWVTAAGSLRPDLPCEAYLDRRRTAAATGDLRVTIHHTDLLALPGADLPGADLPGADLPAGRTGTAA